MRIRAPRDDTLLALAVGKTDLPLYVFCGEFLLGSTLNTADVAPGKQAVEELERIVAQTLARWPDVRIIVRGDSGFCNDEIMAWCEQDGIDYILGQAKNSRLSAEIADEMAAAKAEHARTVVRREPHPFDLGTRARSRRVPAGPGYAPGCCPSCMGRQMAEGEAPVPPQAARTRAASHSFRIFLPKRIQCSRFGTGCGSLCMKGFGM